MVCVAPTRAGDQVFNTYGPLGTSELVRRYGFAHAGENPHDAARLRTSHVVAAAAMASGADGIHACMDTQLRLARSTGLLRTRAFAIPRCGTPPPQLLLLLRALACDGSGAEGARERLRRGVRPALCAPRDPALLRRVAAALSLAAGAALAAMRGGDGEEAAPLSGCCSDNPLHLAVAVRASEKRCLEALRRRAQAEPGQLVLQPGAEARVWRSLLRRIARKRVMDARRRRPRPPDLMQPRVVQRLVAARLIRFRPPRVEPATPPLCRVANCRCDAKLHRPPFVLPGMHE